MATLTKKGHCRHCGKKLAEGWGTICECDGSRKELAPGKFRQCAGGCGSTLPPHWRGPFCEDCHTESIRRNLASAEGVGGETGGPHDEVATVPSPGTFLKDAKGEVYVITSAKITGIRSDGPEIEISARMVPRAPGAFSVEYRDELIARDAIMRGDLDLAIDTGLIEVANALAGSLGTPLTAEQTLRCRAAAAAKVRAEPHDGTGLMPSESDRSLWEKIKSKLR